MARGKASHSSYKYLSGPERDNRNSSRWNILSYPLFSRLGGKKKLFPPFRALWLLPTHFSCSWKWRRYTSFLVGAKENPAAFCQQKSWYRYISPTWQEKKKKEFTWPEGFLFSSPIPLLHPFCSKTKWTGDIRFSCRSSCFYTLNCE